MFVQLYANCIFIQRTSPVMYDAVIFTLPKQRWTWDKRGQRPPSHSAGRWQESAKTGQSLSDTLGTVVLHFLLLFLTRVMYQSLNCLINGRQWSMFMWRSNSRVQRLCCAWQKSQTMLSDLQIFCCAPRWCNSYQQHAEVQLCWAAWPPSCCFFVASSVPHATFLLLSFHVSNSHLLCAHANTHLDCSWSAVRHEWGVGKGLTGDSNCCLTDKWWNACWCNCNEGIIWQALGYVALTLTLALHANKLHECYSITLVLADLPPGKPLSCSHACFHISSSIKVICV